jgi:hypothetical protein
MSSLRTRLRAVPVAMTGAALAALPLLYAVDPNRTRVPLCPLHAATGLWCPLCGATRATHALLHGDLVTALHDNALYVLGLPVFVLLWWQWLQSWADPRPSRNIGAPTVKLLVTVAAVFGVARNLPIGGFLAPPG